MTPFRPHSLTCGSALCRAAPAGGPSWADRPRGRVPARSAGLKSPQTRSNQKILFFFSFSLFSHFILYICAHIDILCTKNIP
jgi:hypothetical protein